MKNTLFIFPQCHLRVLRAVPAWMPRPRAQRGKERQSTPTRFIISLIDFLFFGGLGEDVCNYIVPRNLFFPLPK